MEFDQAGHRYRELQTEHDRGYLDENAFRVEVAKLLLRDEQGAFWMIDADTGAWFCNRGDGWEEGDPRAGQALGIDPAVHPGTVRRGWGQVLATLAVLATLGVGVVLVWQHRPAGQLSRTQPTAIPDAAVRISIASPLDGSEVAVGQEVGIESTLAAVPDLQAVARIELSVDGQSVAARSVRSSLQKGQASLPLSLPWRPIEVGEHLVAVTALSDDGDPLATAAITLYVTEAAAQILPEPDCVPEATFVTDVTIDAGTAFPPGVQMDKVWQVRNEGTCAWGMGYELVLVDGEALGAPTSVPLPLTAAGDLADLTVTFWAPSAAGTYTSVWQLQSSAGEFFGPALNLEIQVQALAQRSAPPAAPANLQAGVTESGGAVRLTWEDRSDNEDAFRIYRQDREASVGLVPGGATVFVDKGIACGRTYQYTVVAFNAAGASSASESVEVDLPPCAPADAPPRLALTVVPTQTLASQTFTLTFEANDDAALVQVLVQGEETGDPVLDAGRVFTCTGQICTGSWLATWTGEISTTLTLVGVARDSSGQESAATEATVAILPGE